MLRLYFQRGFKTPPVTGWVLWTVGLIAVAVVCRFMAGDTPLARPESLRRSAGRGAGVYWGSAVLMRGSGWRVKVGLPRGWVMLGPSRRGPCAARAQWP